MPMARLAVLLAVERREKSFGVDRSSDIFCWFVLFNFDIGCLHSISSCCFYELIYFKTWIDTCREELSIFVSRGLLGELLAEAKLISIFLRSHVC